MATNPTFPFYVNDFEGGTRHLTDEELGCYVRLLLAQFNRGGTLPNNESFLTRFCTSFDKSWPMVKEKFDDIGDGLIQNERLEIERLKRVKFIEHQQVNGRKGGRPSKTQAKPNPFSDQNPSETQPFENTKPNKKPLGNGNGKGNINSLDKEEGGVGEEGNTFLIPRMQEMWYQTVPAYTKDYVNDFPATMEIFKFITRQAGISEDVTDESTKQKVLDTLYLIALEVREDDFWRVKPLKTISGHIQEFYNRIKDKKNGQPKRNSKGTTTVTTDAVKEAHARYYANRQ